MYLYGVGGHSKVVVDILESHGVSIAGYVDDNLQNEWVKEVQVQHDAKGCDPIIVSIGDNLARKHVVEKLLGHTFGMAVHASAIVSKSVSIGEGTVMMAGVVVNAGTDVGKHCIINTNASVDHDCLIGDYVHISPGATICGGVEIESGAHVGAGAVIIPGRKIGAWATIGAGAVVTKDVPAQCVVVGNPARVIRFK